MYHHRLAPNLRPGPSGNEVVKMHAVARLMLGDSMKNIQSSWVKEGPKLAQYLLSAGANDVGGTLDERKHFDFCRRAVRPTLQPRELRRLIRDAGRVPAQRRTNYELLKVFDPEETTTPRLDRVENADSAVRLVRETDDFPRISFRKVTKRGTGHFVWKISRRLKKVTCPPLY